MSQDGIKFILHDFRRTYITIAESLGISPYTYKQLANHKLPSNDVTARYVNLNLEQKRKAQQKITNYILRKAGLRPKAEIVDFNDRATETFDQLILFYMVRVRPGLFYVFSYS